MSARRKTKAATAKREINGPLLRAALDAYRDGQVDAAEATAALVRAGVAPRAAHELIRATLVPKEGARL